MRLFFTSVFLFCSSIFLWSQTYSVTGPMANQRWLHQLQVLQNGEVLVFGGSNGTYSSTSTLKSAELYNPTTETWRLTGSMATAREGFASAVLPNGNVLAIGGEDWDYNRFSSCEIYDATEESWSSAASMNKERSYHSCVVLKDGRVLVAGGYPTENSAELYDPVSNSWSYTEEMNKAHGKDMRLTMLADGRILATGGEGSLSSAEVFDPASGSWTIVGDMKGQRSRHSAVLLNNGKVLLAGGNGLYSGDDDTSELFDPVTETFSVTGDLYNYMTANEAILLNNGNVLIFGMGDFFNLTDTKMIEMYNVASGIWSSPAYYSTLGFNHYRIVRLLNGNILIVGGSMGATALNTCVLIADNTASNTNNVLHDTGMQVYNNGNSLYVTANYDVSGLSWELSDLLGKTVFPNQPLIGGTNVIERNGLPAGTYIFFLSRNGTIVYSKKIIFK